MREAPEAPSAEAKKKKKDTKVVYSTESGIGHRWVGCNDTMVVDSTERCIRRKVGRGSCATTNISRGTGRIS